MAALRLHLLIGTVLITAAGCAAQPRQSGPNAPAAASAGAPAAAAPVGTKVIHVPGLTDHVLKLARDDGYRPRVVDGKFFFCRHEIPIGSNLPIRHCVDVTRLKQEVLEEEQTRQNLEQSPPMMCQPGAC